MKTQAAGWFGPRPAEKGRVTVAMGVEAYRATGARPERGAFARFARSHSASGVVLEAACGFDGQAMPGETWPREPDRRRTLEGQRDGRALWAAVRDGVPSPAPDLPSAKGAPGPAPGEDERAAHGGRPARQTGYPRRAGQRVADGRPCGPDLSEAVAR